MSGNPAFRLKPFDWISLAAAVLVTAASFFYVYAGSIGAGESVVVVEGGGRTWIFPADAEETLKVPGPLGITIVELGGGSAHVHESPCENQICVAAGKISRSGQWIACLPNAVFVRIEGRKDDDAVDAATW